MQTKFKDIAQYYLGTGLELKDDRFGFGHLYKLSTFNISTIFSDKQFSGIKPLLRSLDSLNKPITVKWYNDGKEFVPVNKLKHIYGWEYIWSYCSNKQEEFNVNAISFASIKLLLQWHFNIFNLPETEYIKID